MSVDASKALVRRFIEAVWNDGNLAVIDELVAPDFVNHSAPPGTAADRAGFAQTAGNTRDVFPDFHVTIENVIAEADTVAALFTARGTQQTVWEHPIVGRIASTGKVATWGGVRLFQLRDGKIAGTWVYVDSLGLMQQLGAFPGLSRAIG